MTVTLQVKGPTQMKLEEIAKAVDSVNLKPEEIAGAFTMSADDLQLILIGMKCISGMVQHCLLDVARGKARPEVGLSAVSTEIEAKELAGRVKKYLDALREQFERDRAAKACQQSNIDPKWTGVPPQGTA